MVRPGTEIRLPWRTAPERIVPSFCMLKQGAFDAPVPSLL